MFEKKISGKFVLSSFISAVNWDDALNAISGWASRRDSRYICICNVHSVVTARQEVEFQKVINEADMATPDGMPVAWMLRMLGEKGQQRINGPDLMWKYCELAASRGEPVFFYGSTDATLAKLKSALEQSFPAFKSAGMYSPPFRALSAAEDQQIVDMINGSGAGVVFVGLGCPKQEKWMAEHRGRINAVMVGVGAAFDYHAGTIKRAPLWMQQNGLEWLHRLCSEPRRLWQRYWSTNSRFIYYALKQLVTGKC